MIQSKKDLLFYLREDARRNNVNSYSYYLFGLFAGVERCHILRYLKCLRYLEYNTNCNPTSFISKFRKFYYRYKLLRLGLKYNIRIQPNVVGYGFKIAHIAGGGGVIVNAKAVGNYCGCNSGVIIGNLGEQDKRPIIGDYVSFQMGAKVYGDISIGDNCIIAPNSVVYKTIDANTIVSGVPAQVIANNCNNKDTIIKDLQNINLKNTNFFKQIQ